MRARATLSSLLAAVRRRTAAQDGFVMVFALVLLMIGLAVGAAALAETLSSRSHANRDTRAVRALQAADFGVQEVLYRENQLNIDSLDLTGGTGVLAKLADCIVPKFNKNFHLEGTVTVSVSTSGVSGEASVSACPVGEIEEPKGPAKLTYVPVGNHDYYNAEFVPGERVSKEASSVTFEPKVISIGKDDSDPNHVVYARVEANLAPVEPLKTVEAINNLGFTVPSTSVAGIEVPGATAFNGTARAGKTVAFHAKPETGSTFTMANVLGSGGSVIAPASIDSGCGKTNDFNKSKLPKVTVTPESSLHTVEEGKKCGTPYFSRSSISISGTKPNCSSSCPSTTYYYSGRNEKTGLGNSIETNENEIYNANPATSVELTAGNDYVFCSFYTTGPVKLKEVTSSSLPVRVFIDNPNSSRCKGFVEHSSIKAGSFTATQGVGGGGTTLSPTQMQIYIVGNGTNDGTSFTSSGSTAPTGLASGFFLYAPQSEVTVKGLSFTGMLLGYDVNVETTSFSQDLGLNNYPLSSAAGVFHVTGYRQCALNGASGNPVTQLGSTSAAEDSSGC